MADWKMFGAITAIVAFILILNSTFGFGRVLMQVISPANLYGTVLFNMVRNGLILVPLVGEFLYGAAGGG